MRCPRAACVLQLGQATGAQRHTVGRGEQQEQARACSGTDMQRHRNCKRHPNRPKLSFKLHPSMHSPNHIHQRAALYKLHHHVQPAALQSVR